MSASSHCMAKFRVIAALAFAAVLLGAPSPLLAQAQQPEQAQQQPLSQQEIEQLVAPIALYPDDLLAQVLTASTYPLDVAMAARWVEKNPNVKGAALEAAMQKQPWDPSVKGLTAVPQVLAMMNDKLDWTTSLGEAFLAQPDDVQTAIQTLRAKAEAAGNLKSSKELKVQRVPAPAIADYVGPPEIIVIEPVEPDYVYVPIYNPVAVFGVGFWAPGYVPFFWYPPWWTVGPVFGFGPVIYVGPALWYRYNWGYRGFAAIHVNTTFYRRFNKTSFRGQYWKFNPAHHKTQFKNMNLQRRFKQLPGGLGTKGTLKGLPGTQTKGTLGTKSLKNLQLNKSQQLNKGLKTNKSFKGTLPPRNLGTQTHKSFKGTLPPRNLGTQTHKSFGGTQIHKSLGTQTNKSLKGGSQGKMIKNP